MKRATLIAATSLLLSGPALGSIDRSRDGRQFRPRRVRSLHGERRQGRGRHRQTVQSSRTDGDRQADGHPARIATRCIPSSVFDLDAGPATITLPDAGKRFMSMHGHQRRSLCAETFSMDPVLTRLTRDKSARATRWSVSARWSIPADPDDVKAGSRACRTRSRSARRIPASSRCRNWDPASAEKDPRRAAGACLGHGRTSRGRSAQRARSIRSST